MIFSQVLAYENAFLDGTAILSIRLRSKYMSALNGIVLPGESSSGKAGFQIFPLLCDHFYHILYIWGFIPSSRFLSLEWYHYHHHFQVRFPDHFRALNSPFNSPLWRPHKMRASGKFRQMNYLNVFSYPSSLHQARMSWMVSSRLLHPRRAISDNWKQFCLWLINNARIAHLSSRLVTFFIFRILSFEDMWDAAVMDCFLRLKYSVSVFPG